MSMYLILNYTCKNSEDSINFVRYILPQFKLKTVTATAILPSHSKIILHSERYQPSSSPQNLSWNHNFCRNLHTPSFLVQPLQTKK